MNENAEMKICPFCAETIKAAAKKCPFCNSRLSRYALFRQELALGSGCLIVFGCLIVVCALVLPKTFSGEGRSFARYRNDLLVKDCSVSVEGRDTNDYYYNVSGFVTNQGENPWRVQEFELTVTNIQGIADVMHTKVSDPFVIQPHAENAFVVHCRTSLTNKVVSGQARVENASDGTVLEKGDY